MSSDWPFKDTRTTMAISVKRVFQDGQPILFVSHDQDDGMWQFRHGQSDPGSDEGMIICLGDVVASDPTVNELSDLPLGWTAWREKPSDPWQRAPRARPN